MDDRAVFHLSAGKAKTQQCLHTQDKRDASWKGNYNIIRRQLRIEWKILGPVVSASLPLAKAERRYLSPSACRRSRLGRVPRTFLLEVALASWKLLAAWQSVLYLDLTQLLHCSFLPLSSFGQPMHYSTVLFYY